MSLHIVSARGGHAQRKAREAFIPEISASHSCLTFELEPETLEGRFDMVYIVYIPSRGLYIGDYIGGYYSVIEGDVRR